MLGTAPWVVKPLQDEFALGHAGRIHRLNAMTGEFSTLGDYFRRSCKARTGAPSPSAVHGLAVLSGCEPIEYAKSHTLLPFWAWAFGKAEVAEPRDWPLRTVRMYGLSTAGHLSKWCPFCAERDLAHVGFSYWRRPHQLPGVLRCGNHQIPLLTIRGENAFLRFPHELDRQSLPIPFESNDEGHAVVHRYQAIAMRMLEGPKAFSTSVWELLDAQKARIRTSCWLGTQRKTLRVPLGACHYLSKAWEDDINPPVGIFVRQLKRAIDYLEIRGAPALAAALALGYASAHDAIDTLNRIEKVGAQVQPALSTGSTPIDSLELEHFQ